MKYLEDFYNEQVKVGDMPEFKDLTDGKKKDLSKSYGYVTFEFKKACANMGKSGEKFSKISKRFREAIKPFIDKNGVLKD